ncbi:MAG: hypothetical protein QOI20_1803 [Acidimicrobiaceae bacterium]|nr:hypothetical protein [Acidimicrobiaceae bacterium]
MERGDDDAGAGVVSTVFGVSIFLVFMLFAAQLLLGLYAESVVGAVTFDAAKTVAGANSIDDPSAPARADVAARRRLGRLGDGAAFDWAVSDDAVRLTVRVRRPPVLPGLLPDVRGPIVRRVRVRAERVR